MYSPSPFFSALATHYVNFLNQIHPYSILRAVAFHILCCLYEVEDSICLIHTTHTLKHTLHIYFLSPKSDKNVSFISHQSVDKDFQKHYFCVKPSLDAEELPYSLGQWRPNLMAKPGPPRELSEDEASLLSDLSSYYKPKGSFPLRFLTENSHALEE